MIAQFYEPFGWTLLHFLWQGTAIAAVYGGLLLCFRQSARARYAAGLGAMACMGLAFAVTLICELSAAPRDGSVKLAALAKPERDQAEAPEILPPALPAIHAAPAKDGPRPSTAGKAVVEPAPAPSAGALSVSPAPVAVLPSAWTERVRAFLPWIVALWCAGVLVLTLRFTVGWRNVRRMKASGTPPEDSALLQRFSQLCTRLKISRPVRLLTSASVGVPVLIGWLKPVVVIPAALLAGLSPAQTDAILAHELAHVRRNDFLINALQCLLEAVLFYHPAVWWISGRLRSGREHCCDDIAAACCGTPADYARALAALEEWRSDSAPALSMAASGGSLLERVRRLLEKGDAVAELPVWPLSLLAGSVALLLLPLVWVHAGESDGKSAQDAVQPAAAAQTQEPEPFLASQPGKWDLGGGVTMMLAESGQPDGGMAADLTLEWAADQTPNASGQLPALRLTERIASAGAGKRQSWAIIGGMGKVPWGNTTRALWIVAADPSDAKAGDGAKPAARYFWRLIFADPRNVVRERWFHADVNSVGPLMGQALAPLIAPVMTPPEIWFSKLFAQPAVEVRTRDSFTVRGVVRDSAGKPIAGLKVHILPGENIAPLSHPSPPGAATTDAAGAYGISFTAPLSMLAHSHAVLAVPALANHAPREGPGRFLLTPVVTPDGSGATPAGVRRLQPGVAAMADFTMMETVPDRGAGDGVHVMIALDGKPVAMPPEAQPLFAAALLAWQRSCRADRSDSVRPETWDAHIPWANVCRVLYRTAPDDPTGKLKIGEMVLPLTPGATQGIYVREQGSGTVHCYSDGSLTVMMKVPREPALLRSTESWMQRLTAALDTPMPAAGTNAAAICCLQDGKTVLVRRHHAAAAPGPRGPWAFIDAANAAAVLKACGYDAKTPVAVQTDDRWQPDGMDRLLSGLHAGGHQNVSLQIVPAGNDSTPATLAAFEARLGIPPGPEGKRLGLEIVIGAGGALSMDGIACDAEAAKQQISHLAAADKKGYVVITSETGVQFRAIAPLRYHAKDNGLCDVRLTKSAAAAAAAGKPPTIAGLSLEGVPEVTDVTALKDYTDWPMDEGVLEVPLLGTGAWAIFRMEQRVQFYVETGGKTYGPVAGDVFEKLPLMTMLREALAGRNYRDDALAVLKEMAETWYFLRAGLHLENKVHELILELKEPRTPDEYDYLLESLTTMDRQRMRRIPEALSVRSIEHLKSMVEAGKKKTGTVSPAETAPPSPAAGGGKTAKVEKKKLEKSSYHDMDKSLLQRWRDLEVPDATVIPESRVATLREAVGSFVAGIEESPYSLTPEQTEKLKALQTRDANLPGHSVEAAGRFITEVFAIHGEPIQMAFNVSPWPGRKTPKEELERLPFGPPAHDGLRAAVVAGKNEFVFGDTRHLEIHLWNTGDKTILTGIGRDAPGLYPQLVLNARGKDGRQIAVTQGPPGTMLRDIKFTKTWQLRPGESAIIYGYLLHVGSGKPMQETSWPEWYTTFEMPDVQSGEEVELAALLPYPNPPGAQRHWPDMQCGPLKLRALAPADVKVWTTTTKSTWTLEGGVQLEIMHIGLNGPNIASSAILTWPAGEGRPEKACEIGIAADMFGNRERWGMAWDVGQKVLWIAVAEVGRPTQPGFQATELRRVDFSNPEQIEVRRFDGWPAEGGPSAECVAKLNALLAAPAGKQTGTQTLKAGPPEEMPSVKFNRAIRTGSATPPALPEKPELPALPLDPAAKLKLAIAAADGFFKAGNAASKMKYLRLDDATRAAAERHFQKHGARAEDKAHVILSRVQDDGSVVLAYDLHARSQFVRATEQGSAMLLDWENSTMCQQGVYHVAEKERPAEAFRILAVSRSEDYYNHGFADQKRWSCESLRFPGVEGRLFGYVDRTTPEFKMLQERHQQGLSTTLAFTVRFPADGKGEDQVEILRVEPLTGAVNTIGKAAPAYHGQKEIRTAGTVQLSPRLTVKVTSDLDEGNLRNTLEIEGTDDAGNKITDTAALPYGTDTWALLIEEPATPDGSCIVSIGSRWGVRRFAFASDKQRARFSKPGFDTECRWYASEKQFFTETLPQFANAAVVDWWDNRLRHMLKVETPRDQPALEVRLVCEETELLTSKGPEVPQMILPLSPLGPSRLARFINLGTKLLGAEDLEYGGAVLVSTEKEITRIRDAGRPAFKALCRRYGGRQAAVVSNGEVIGTFKLESDGMDSFWTYRRPAYAHQSASAMVRAKLGASGVAAHIIAVQDSTGKAIPAFRIIAGVRSSVSADFEKKHNCSVVNWQSHMLREGKDGRLEWSLSEKSYDEMVLRIEADGYVPQMTGWLKKAEGAQEITFQLAPDPGIRGSVQTHGGGRWAHDATVVLGMIRREIRIKGATFPELDLGPEPKTLRDQWDRPRVFQPDEQGRFTLPDEVDPTAVVLILHGDGVYLKPYAEWKKSPHVQLEPWGRINGRVRWGQRVGAGEKVDLSITLGDEWGWPDVISQRDSETANEDGAFVFQRLIPGVTAQLSSPVKVKDDKGAELTFYESARITHVKTESPSGSALMGGRGRLVSGKLKGRASWDGVTFHFHPTAPHIGREGDGAMWKAWTALQQSPDGPLFFRNGLKVAADGTFRIEGMLPGSYQIFFTGPDGKERVGSTQIRVPAEDRDDAEPAPYDAGEITAR